MAQIVPSIFGALVQGANMQAMIDNTLNVLYGDSVWRRYLTPGIPTMDLTFNTVIGRSRIEAAASIVDADSSAPLRSHGHLERLSGKIPTMKQKFRMSDTDLRKMHVLMETRLISDDARKRAMLDAIYNDVRKCATAGDKRVDIMLMQALSTLKIDVSATNNPDGVAFGTLDLLAGRYQKQGVKIAWSSSSTSKPLTDIQDYVEFAYNNYGRTFTSIKMSRAAWTNFMKSAEVISRLQTFFNVGKANASFAVTLDNVNAMMVANQWPTIEVINYATGVESDGIISTVQPFATESVTFVTTNGALGTLEWAPSMETLHPIENKNYATFGPTLVGKWCENDPLTEFTAMEMNAFPAIDVDQVWVLRTETVQAGGFDTTGSWS